MYKNGLPEATGWDIAGKKKDTSQQSKPDLYNPYRGQKQNEQMLEKCKADLK